MQDLQGAARRIAPAASLALGQGGAISISEVILLKPSRRRDMLVLLHVTKHGMVSKVSGFQCWFDQYCLAARLSANATCRGVFSNRYLLL